VNRLSFGVQSFREDELAARTPSLGRPRAGAVADARAAGFDNISIDLMMWLPDQDVEQWLRSIREAILIAPDHLSLYILRGVPAPGVEAGDRPARLDPAARRSGCRDVERALEMLG
jgi:oxygen-independent coproporphyrinogen-3 oxidase